MHKRSSDFWTAAFFLSRYGRAVNGSHAIPPAELNTDKWNEAYRMFYETIGGGRTITSFERSLKNARDAYDSHLGDSKRIGWLNENKEPNQLNEVSKAVFETWLNKTRGEIWQKLEPLVNKNTAHMEEIFNDVSAMEDTDQARDIKTRTEGGKKAVISYRYERNASNRKDAFDNGGFDCTVCGFNFGKAYGKWGDGFAEVHHMVPLSATDGQERQTNPQTDLVIVCSNCHRMMHRKKGITLTVEELKSKLATHAKER